jgi:hypothetical protein
LGSFFRLEFILNQSKDSRFFANFQGFSTVEIYKKSSTQAGLREIRRSKSINEQCIK